MNKRVSIIKDVFTNTPHVLAVENSEQLVSVKALTEYGQSIIDEGFSAQQYNSWKLPDGFTKTEFKELTPDMQKIFDASFENAKWTNVKANELITKAISHQKYKSFVNRTTSKQEHKSNFKNPSNDSLRKFRNKINKITILNYKAQLFKDNSKTSSLVDKIKSNELAFDSINNIISTKQDNNFALDALEKIVIDSQNLRLLRRGMGTKNSEDVLFVKTKKRRTLRRAKSLHDDSTDEMETNLTGTQKLKESIKSKFKRGIGKTR